MRTDASKSRKSRSHRRAFTLIELLVVVAIIALLVSILLPSLASARAQAKAIKCATNLRGIGQSMALYLAVNRVYPASYLYASDKDGDWNLKDQYDGYEHPFGYLHWSYFLYSKGKVRPESFECPALLDGGCPPTNPGPNADNWMPTQVDQTGAGQSANSIEDKQAPRMAYTVNAAICPRNKFVKPAGSSTQQRVNRFVVDAEIKQPGRTVLSTEFNKTWKNAAVKQGNGFLSKSHRSILPFGSLSGGTGEMAPYNIPLDTATYVYGDGQGTKNYGLLPSTQLDSLSDVINGDHDSILNVVARHHPGGADNKDYPGTANFLYCDSHVERKSILETMDGREWGDKFYSITGENGVLGRNETVGEQKLHQ